MKKTFIYICLAAIAAASLLASCSKSSTGEAPIITGVRVCDPEKADSLFSQASQGSTVSIVGEHLANTQKLFLNDQEVTFNCTFNTDHSLVFTIPTEYNGFELSFWHPELRNEIRLETLYGTAIYEFRVLCPSGYINSFIAESYPIEEGTTMKVEGVNLIDITEIYFTDADLLYKTDAQIRELRSSATVVTVPEYKLSVNRVLNEKNKSYDTQSILTFPFPALSFESGWFVIDTPQGCILNEYQTMPPAEIQYVSSLMPVKGETVTLTGKYFVNVLGVKVGDTEISDFNVKSSNEMSFVMCEAPSETSTLTVLTGAGEASILFYDYSTLLVNFETEGMEGSYGVTLGWSPAAPVEEEHNGVTGSGFFAVFDETPASWWGTMAYYGPAWGDSDNLLPFSLPDISADTPATDVYLSFEAYTTIPFVDAYVHYLFQTTSDVDYEYAAEYDWDASCVGENTLGNADGETPYGEWFNAVVPLSKFGFATYGDFVAAEPNRVRLMSRRDFGVSQDVCYYIDNIRIEAKQ